MEDMVDNVLTFSQIREYTKGTLDITVSIL